ncbi:hypothetical protein BDQ17DRAFT_1377991 [Cyathus striatus]|nr:hypothetical protein BDQ17DRAFT_1377991 [Cyathus striatus]
MLLLAFSASSAPPLPVSCVMMTTSHSPASTLLPSHRPLSSSSLPALFLTATTTTLHLPASSSSSSPLLPLFSMMTTSIPLTITVSTIHHPAPSSFLPCIKTMTSISASASCPRLLPLRTVYCCGIDEPDLQATPVL